MTLGGASVSAIVRTRTNLALHHLLAAGRCAARVTIVENDNHGNTLGPFWDEILQDSLGVATLTVAALEGYANEIWFENEPVASDINQVAARSISELIDRESILRKYSLALAFNAGKNLDQGTQPVQDVDALIRLRNEVVHFRPEWLGEQEKHEKLSRQLSGKFRPSQFFQNEPLFPRAWATASFVSWAVRSTVNFIDFFYEEAGLHNPLQKFRPRLEEVSGIDL